MEKNFGKLSLIQQRLCIIGAALFFCWLVFHFNLLGIQDRYYGSKYLRPYAELKQQQGDLGVIQLKDGRVFIPNAFKTEIFDPKTKKSEIVQGMSSLKVSIKNPSFININESILFFQRSAILGCVKTIANMPSVRFDFCPNNKTPLFDAKEKRFSWYPFPFQNIDGLTAIRLKNGKIFFVGGYIAELDKVKFPDKLFYYKNSIAIYNPTDLTSMTLGGLKIPRQFPDVILTRDEKYALVFGGSFLTGDWLKDSYTLDHEPREKSIELVDLKTGKSTTVGDLPLSPLRKPIPFDSNNGLYVFPLGVIRSHVSAMLVDISNPKKIKTEIFKGPEIHPGSPAGGSCAVLPNFKIICISHEGIIEIDPINKTVRTLEARGDDKLIDHTIINDSKIGVLVFARSRYLGGDYKTVQRFDYERYVRDLESGER